MAKLSALHRFLIRNAELFPTARLGRFLGVPESRVRRWMAALGLPEMRLVEKERIFPLVLRRNHDILPEEEIARLLKMRLEACRKHAQEMDFLDIKLGPRPSELPSIDPEAPADDESSRLFRELCAGYFQDYSEWERPFSFLEALADKEGPLCFGADAAPKQTSADDSLSLRIMYSYTGSHGDFLLTGEDFYSEGILSRLANRDVNAGWMPALLRDLAPSHIFPEFGEGHEVRIEDLRKQVEKAGRYGIRIFLYLNEPRFMPGAFFERHPGARGMPAPQADHFGMCTSDEEVRRWLRESAEFVFRAVPGLGGVILITASENQTNCYSRYPTLDDDGLGLMSKDCAFCPRCGERGPGAVLSDVANLLHEAAVESGRPVQVIQWLWGWDLIVPREEVKSAIKHLPSGVAVMVDWAKNTPFSVFGREASIGEYTLAHVQPSDFARGIIGEARERGHKVMARCALVTTVEMNALPYLPVITNVETLLTELRNEAVDGIQASWIFGAYPGRNMEMLAHRSEPHPAESLARKYYGAGAQEALEAWRLFSEGMAYYPTVVSVLYLSAVNPGPGLRFSLEPEPWRHGMVAMASERIEEISGPFGADVMIRGFRAVAEHFQRGLEQLDRAIAASDRPEWHEENLRDHRICETCMRHFITAANHAEFIVTRDRWLNDRANRELTSALARILSDELANAEAMLALAASDSRIGYEGSVGYFYTPIEIIEKIYGLTTAAAALSRKH